MQTLTYSELKTWAIDIPQSFPEKGKLKKDVRMAEHFWEWNENNIHIDHYSNENASAKIIVLHGIGGTGRLLSFLSVPLWKAGFEILCPDLPPFGLSIHQGDEMMYKDWSLMINDLVNHERSLDDKPIFLFGQGTSGSLAYDVATYNEGISGIIVTSLIDQMQINLRMGETLNTIINSIDLPDMKNINRFEPDFYLPLNGLVNTRRLVNNNEICQILKDDPYSWNVELSINFIISFLMTKQTIEPEKFDHCPLLLVLPENDLMTKIESSESFFNRLACEKKLVLLKNGGHFPMEEPGFSDLLNETNEFINEIVQVSITNE